jgi:hypothetical protein
VFRDEVAGRSAASGLAVDQDHALWIADTPAGRVRRFSVFGLESGGFGPDPTPTAVLLPGSIHRPVDVTASSAGLVVACAGESPHAVQWFDPEAGYRGRCRSLGDPALAFLGVRRVASLGQRLLVAEGLARRVQVFRGGEFQFAFQLRDTLGRKLEPCAVATHEDGRSVVGVRDPESAVLLVDGSGRTLRVLARGGQEEGRVLAPCDLVLEAGEDDRRTRLYVLDSEATRLQVFTLEGASQGSIPIAPASSAKSERGRPAPVRRGKRGGR